MTEDRTPPEFGVLPWDSAFFGRRIARATIDALDLEQVERLREWASKEEVECIYVPLPAGNPNALRTAEGQGMRLVDVRIDFTREISDEDHDVASEVEIASADESDRLGRLIEGAFRESRFYADGAFSTEQCEALYQRWLTESFGGTMGDVTLVARGTGGPLGLVTCQVRPVGVVRIGLVGVGPHARGGGVGRRLVTGATRWAAAAGAGEIRVATQAGNVRAQRLYQHCGFRTREVTYWYHWWPGRDALPS